MAPSVPHGSRRTKADAQRISPLLPTDLATVAPFRGAATGHPPPSAGL